MTQHTLRGFVHSGQNEFRILCMIESNRLPAAGIMTLTTILAQLTTMTVDGLVAGKARG